MTVSHVTTHVLDTGNGLPARGVQITLSHHEGDAWVSVATGVTDADGRVRALGPEHLATGVYRLEFGTGPYFTATGVDSFFPEVAITFHLDGSTAHYHVPLLLSPFAYSTYRGS